MKDSVLKLEADRLDRALKICSSIGLGCKASWRASRLAQTGGFYETWGGG